MTPEELHARLLTLADPACKAFGDSLQPGVTDRLGVRMPLVRRVARDVMRTEDVRALAPSVDAIAGAGCVCAFGNGEVIRASGEDFNVVDLLA